MSREVRLVPADWKHPTDGRYTDGSTRHVALFEGSKFAERLADWEAGAAKWAEGLRDDYRGGWKRLDGTEEATTYEEWSGERPDPADYMPQWPDAERTHLMMYETCSEGSPISPAFKTAEELARWLADNNASMFGSTGGDYAAWMRVIKGSYEGTTMPGMPNVVFL